MAGIKMKHIVHPDVRQKIVDYLVSNQEHIKERTKNFTTLRDAMMSEIPKELHGDLNDEYRREVFSFLYELLAYDLAVDTESIMIVTEGMDLTDYLGVTI